jgi:hypothetical protein
MRHSGTVLDTVTLCNTDNAESSKLARTIASKIFLPNSKYRECSVFLTG